MRLALLTALVALLTVHANGAYLNHIIDRIYVGDINGARDLKTLVFQHNITAILNVAWDADVRYDPSDYFNGHLPVEYNKLGLVDGTGNDDSMLAAAVYALDQLL